MNLDDYKPKSIPGYYYAIFIETYYYEQLPVFDPNHEYHVIQEEHNFVDILFNEYNLAVKYVLNLYPEAQRCGALSYTYEEENDIQITSITNIYIKHCITDTLIKEENPEWYFENLEKEN